MISYTDGKLSCHRGAECKSHSAVFSLPIAFVDFKILAKHGSIDCLPPVQFDVIGSAVNQKFAKLSAKAKIIPIKKILILI